MSTREKQKKLVSRIRRSVVASAVAASVGVAGYLGISTQSATASDTSTTDSGTSSTDSSSSSDGSSFASQNGGTTQVDSGSGSSHATSSGS